jgi:hypothetical protein
MFGQGKGLWIFVSTREHEIGIVSSPFLECMQEEGSFSDWNRRILFCSDRPKLATSDSTNFADVCTRKRELQQREQC